jgi:hypothetical protein
MNQVRGEVMRLGAELAEVRRELDELKERERRRAVGRRRAARLAALASLAALLVTTAVVAEPTVVFNCPGGELFCFSPNTPAKSREVNHNFARVTDWIDQKVGTPGDPNVDIQGDVTVAAGKNVTAGGNVSASGDLSTSSYLTVTQGALFDCAGCGSTSTLRGSSDWGDMTIQGRVLSATSNIHLSPPGGSDVIIDDTYRAAGGSNTGAAGLQVEGNIVANANTRDGCAWTGCYDSPEVLYCPDGKYMAGISLPEYGGNEGTCGNEDDFSIYCCEL